MALHQEIVTSSLGEIPAPRPPQLSVIERTCNCGCHAIHHFKSGICRFYEQCHCDGITCEVINDAA